MKTTLIIFSKNRPLQLDLCLNSVKQNLNGSFDVFVLFDRDEEYVDAYEALQKEHPDVQFWLQKENIYKDLYYIAVSVCNPRTCFLTDDCIVYRPSINIDAEDLFPEEAICYSLRLGLNTTKRYHRWDGKIQEYDDLLRWFPQQHISKYKHGIIYDRTQHLQGGYWGNPLSVDGHIFRSEEVFEWLDELILISKHFKYITCQSPNHLETNLQRWQHLTGQFMCVDEQSCVVNSPNNKVSDTQYTINGVSYNLPQEEALEIFQSGARIDLAQLDFENINCPHTEINLTKGIKTCKEM